REGARHRADEREGLAHPTEHRQARGQGGSADDEADGSPRRPRRRPEHLVEFRHFREGDRGFARVKVFGIDPGSDRTGYGCVETDGSRHRLVICGAIKAPPAATFPEKLLVIHSRLTTLLSECRPDSVAIENLFHATNVRSALKLGHARGGAMLAAAEAGVPIFEYPPAEVKRVVVGYGRAEKPQVQHMI